MSGIAGIVHFDGAPIAPGLVETMTGAMAHRGPDGIDHWVNGSVALGQCMLRTTPESLEEHQPLTNEDESLVLVMDGRVDNWEELRRELLAHAAVLRNRSDAELVLRAYETWASDCLSHIDGDFALVIWDARRREAFCARDRIGNKPFHYHWDGRTFSFASDLHAILALPWVREELNEGMVAEFLANDWHSRDETFWLGVQRLVAAHRMAVDARGPRPEQYWEPDLDAAVPCTGDDEHAEYYLALFTDVVRRMSRSSQPLACEVSGGLDSSAIFAVAEQLRRQRKLLAPRVDGYTLAFHDDPDANDLPYARAVGEHLGAVIQEIAPSRMPLSWYRDWARRYREFPSYPNGVMGLGIREEARRRGSRVLLVGVGGDEWLCGSHSYYAEALIAKQWRTFVDCLNADRRAAGLLRSLGWAGRHGFYPLLPENFRALVRKVLIGHRRDEEIDRLAWLAPAMKALAQQRRDEHSAPPAGPAGTISQRGQLLSFEGGFSILARELEERMAASAGIELRRPFFDSTMVQFAFSTSPQLRLRGRVDRYLHRKAMKGLLPDAVLSREQKAGFSLTFRWYLPDLERMLAADDRDRSGHWVDPVNAMQLYHRAVRDKDSSVPMWLLWAQFGCKALVASP
jgi:asparagine synthase (glutamine-hydrolysing)